jgi:D-xylose transport system permease protein
LSLSQEDESGQTLVQEIIGRPSELSLMLKRFKSGDSGLIPVLIGLVAMVLYFYFKNHVFLSVVNINNLFIQATIFVLLGMGEIWLLLLGEIDLSLGYLAGIAAATSAILVDVQYHWPWYIALPGSVLLIGVLGLLSGVLVVYLKLPSFIVTLAGLLGYEGIMIFIIDRQNTGGTIAVHGGVLDYLVNGQLTVIATWILLIALVGLASFFMMRSYYNRRKSGLVYRSIYFTVAKIIGMVIGGFLLALVFNTNRGGAFIVQRGMPFAIPIDIAMLLAGTFILTKTRTGRYMYAIGGNKEAARRAGINVNRYRLLAFAFGGLSAGVAGLLYCSELAGANDSIPGGNFVLYAVAAAVIGGTSLVGGRGKMIHAVIGGLLIAIIYNGMALINMSVATQYVAIAVVLLAAVTVDSLARRGNVVGTF